MQGCMLQLETTSHVVQGKGATLVAGAAHHTHTHTHTHTHAHTHTHTHKNSQVLHTHPPQGDFRMSELPGAIQAFWTLPNAIKAFDAIKAFWTLPDAIKAYWTLLNKQCKRHRLGMGYRVFRLHGAIQRLSLCQIKMLGTHRS